MKWIKDAGIIDRDRRFRGHGSESSPRYLRQARRPPLDGRRAWISARVHPLEEHGDVCPRSGMEIAPIHAKDDEGTRDAENSRHLGRAEFLVFGQHGNTFAAYICAKSASTAAAADGGIESVCSFRLHGEHEVPACRPRPVSAEVKLPYDRDPTDRRSERFGWPWQYLLDSHTVSVAVNWKTESLRMRLS